MPLCVSVVCCTAALATVLTRFPCSLCGVSVCVLCVCWQGDDASCFAFGRFYPGLVLWLLLCLSVLQGLLCVYQRGSGVCC